MGSRVIDVRWHIILFVLLKHVRALVMDQGLAVLGAVQTQNKRWPLPQRQQMGMERKRSSRKRGDISQYDRPWSQHTCGLTILKFLWVSQKRRVLKKDNEVDLRMFMLGRCSPGGGIVGRSTEVLV